MQCRGANRIEFKLLLFLWRKLFLRPWWVRAAFDVGEEVRLALALWVVDSCGTWSFCRSPWLSWSSMDSEWMRAARDYETSLFLGVICIWGTGVCNFTSTKRTLVWRRDDVTIDLLVWGLEFFFSPLLDWIWEAEYVSSEGEYRRLVQNLVSWSQVLIHTILILLFSLLSSFVP